MSDTNTTTPPAATEPKKVEAPKAIAPVASKVIQPITPTRLQLSEHVQQVYVATVERGVTRSDMLDPAFWAHVSGMLRPRYEIRVFCEDDSFYATYLVLACDKTWAKVHEIAYHDLNSKQLTQGQLAKILEDYDVQFRGPKKWSVLRKTDRAVLQENMHSRDDANQWLVVHLNSQSAVAA